jgi:hypothetical protein
MVFTPRYFDFRAALRALIFGVFFFADFLAALIGFFFMAERPLLPPKIFSQLSEYCLVAPTRVMVMGSLETPECKNEFLE